jgi:hypothetical protein
MPFKFAKNTITAVESCAVEDALPLLEFLQSHRMARVNLGSCIHLHTAVLQVLMAVRPQIVALPKDMLLASWLLQVLGPPRIKAAK